MIKKWLLALAIVTTAYGQGAAWTASGSGSTNAATEINNKLNYQYGAGAPSGLNCTVGKDRYLNTTNSDVYECSVTGTPGSWVKIGSILLAGTNITLSSGVGGTTISATAGSSAPSFPTNAQTSTYQLLASDFSNFKTIVVASGTFTITAVASGSQPAGGQGVWIINYGSGVVTFARSGQNINESATNLTIPAGSASAPNGLFVVSDGTNYFAQTLGTSASTVSSFTGDGTLLNNSSSTGAVTATLANVGAHKYWGNNTGGTTTPGYESIVAGDLPTNIRARGISFTMGDVTNSSALTTSNISYITVPFACTISAYNLAIDAGTITVKFWKVATGTAIPTSGNSINTSGVGIASGTAIHSTTVTDFTTTTVSANDIMAMAVTAVATAKFVNGVLECDQ